MRHAPHAIAPVVLSLLLPLLTVVPVHASFPGSNEIGVFVDEIPTGEPLDVDVDVPEGEQFDLYLCLLDPQVPPGAPRQVAAWELCVSVLNGYQILGEWDYQGGFNIGNTSDPSCMQFIVGNGAAPLQPDANGVILLASLQGYLTSGTQPIVFVLKGFPWTESFPQTKQFGYAADEIHLIACTAVTGGAFDPSWGAYVSNPVLIINNDGSYEPPVANEERSWGEVKTLYR